MNHARYAPLFLSAVLPLLLFRLMLPAGAVQLDLLLWWLIAMLLVGLPLLFSETALAYRSTNTPLLGMQKLTREADSTVAWRAFSWGSVLFAVVLGASLIALTSGHIAQLLSQNIGVISQQAVAFALTVLALMLSALKTRLLPIAAITACLAMVVGLATSGLPTLAMTPTNFYEWALAVTLAIFSVGIGTGLYWFTLAQSANAKNTAPLTPKVLPIWGVQVVFGIVAMMAQTTGSLAIWLISIASLIGCGFLWHYAQSQLQARVGLLKSIPLLVITALLLVLLPKSAFVIILTLLGLALALVLALFVGFAMKISHLRKTLNFKNELRYNLWRIAIRWLAPLALLSALVGIWLS